MLPSWEEPVPADTPEAEWLDWIVPYYEVLVWFLAPCRGEVLIERHWTSAQAVLDVVPRPTSVELLNSRWREFVCVVWKSFLGWEQRQAAMRAARR